MKTIKTYQYKLYRSKQTRHLNEAIDTAASVWNYCIAFHRHYYRMYGKYVSKYSLMAHITKIKRTIHPEWKVLGSQAIQNVVERVDRSYQAFFKHYKQKRSGKKSPPKFKKINKYSSFTLKQSGYKFYKNSNKVTIMGKNYKYSKSRQFDGKIKIVTVKRNHLGEFYIYIVCETERNEVIPRAGKAAGYDFGLKHFLTANDGSIIDSPEWYKNSLNDIRKAHKAVSRCQKGSNNRKRALLCLNRAYEKISNQRRDWFFKLANKIVGENAIICIEDLDIESMKKRWGRKVSDYAFGEFVSILEHVASKTGTDIVKIGRWTPSSKVCHVCGYKNDALSLNDREWVCPHCGSHLDRDINAAINIKNTGLAILYS